MRKLLMAALASGVFGGMVGALATAASSSGASTAAIAAAVQRVEDRSAEQTLTRILVATKATDADTQTNRAVLYAQGAELEDICDAVSTNPAVCVNSTLEGGVRRRASEASRGHAPQSRRGAR